MTYEPEVVIQAFIQFNPGAQFTLEDIEAFDAELTEANDKFIEAMLIAQEIQNPTRFDKSRVLQFAIASGDGDFGTAIAFGAATYRHAIDIRVIG